MTSFWEFAGRRDYRNWKTGLYFYQELPLSNPEPTGQQAAAVFLTAHATPLTRAEFAHGWDTARLESGAPQPNPLAGSR
ncbi:MAG: hypothetical protein U1F76_22450 [Candidatus Competibacteraceae bacterium]